MSSTFIVGCARSGTTSLLKAIGLSRQATCLVEPAPNLNIESREMLEGRLGDPYKPLAEHVAPRIAKGKEVLYEHALKGYQGSSGVMPAKGGRADLSDDLVKAAVDHMVDLAK